MRILITGGAGFLGSQLCAEFLGRGARVRALDDLSTGSLENLQHLLPRGLEFFRGSVLDGPTLADAARDCDAIVHLAARVGVRLLFAGPELTLRENENGTANAISQACEKKIPILIASSSEVYSRGFDRPLREADARIEDLPARPRFFYGRSKLLGEMALAQAAAASGIPARAVRLFNVVGPRQSDRYGMVIPTLLAQARGGIPLTVYGDGMQRRCFASVEEVAPLLASLLPRSPGFDVVNLGNERSVRIGELAERIREAVGSRSPIRFVDPRVCVDPDFEDFPSRVPELGRLRALGLTPPQKSIEELLPWLISNSARNRASASYA